MDKQVSVDGGAGDDALVGGAGPETFFGGTGDDSVDGNQGNDVALLGGGNDRFTWDPGDANDTVEGQGNTDTLAFNGSDAAEILGVAANGGRVRLTRNIANITMDLDDVEALNVRTLGSSDLAAVDDLAGTDLQDGHRRRRCRRSPARHRDPERDGGRRPALGRPQRHRLRARAAQVHVTGLEADRDSFRLDSLAGRDTVTYAGTSNADAFDFATTAAAAVRGRGVDVVAESIVAAGGNGTDTFSAIGNTAPLTEFTFDGGGNNDTIRGSNGVDRLIGGDGNDLVDGNQGNDIALLGTGNDRFTWDPGDASDTVEGQGGTDMLDFNGSAASENLTLSPNGGRVRFTRDIAGIVMDLDDVEALNALAASGTDTATVNDLTGTDLKTATFDQAETVIANGTSANDRFSVTPDGTVTGMGATFRATTIQGGGGTDTATYTGTNGADTIATTTNGTLVRVGVVDNAVERIVLNGLGGNDTFSSSGNLAPLAASRSTAAPATTRSRGPTASTCSSAATATTSSTATRATTSPCSAPATTASTGTRATRTTASKARAAPTRWPSTAARRTRSSPCRPTAAAHA